MADIVIVEDNESVARAYATGLEMSGHSVRVARDDGELRKALEMRHPDLVLLDVGLPGLDGVEILRELKEDPDTAGIRVAIISNYTDRNLVHRALRLEAIDFIEKASLTPSLLVDQVRRWLEH